uniref:Ribosomal RNA-processing protein 42 n=1 Tax=Amorphochlora amoebiformis TaxID=1561963 RepID=A0A7S0GZ67_9EUKA
MRADGRRRMDYRFFDMNTEVVLSANGSARLQLDHTDVLVAVKVAIGEPDVATPDQGRVECSVTCAPSASLRYEGRGAETLNVYLTSGLSRLISSAVDVKKLSIVPRSQCWVVYVDAIVLDSSGNLRDALSMAAYAALKTTTVPAIQVVKGEDAKETIVEVSDDPFETIPLPINKQLPISISLTKIGACFVVDSSGEEESCMSAKVTFAIDRDGKICSTTKTGIGGISSDMLMEMMRVAAEKGKEMVAKIESKLKDDDTKKPFI